jgi:pilus assembly protein CpaB
MNKRFVAVLIFAFVVALGASVMLYRLTSRTQTTKAAPATAKLVVASRDLEVGSVLRQEDVTLADWMGGAPAGAATRPQDVVGRGVITKIVAKEPILEPRLAPRGAGGGFQIMIPKGMRAVAVPVNEVVGVAGFVVPGTRVDILISGAPPNSPANLGTLTKTLLQNIEVLSAGQDFKKDAEGKPIAVQVVNVLVTPEQAEQLSLASRQTAIQLVLRNPLDHDVAKTTGTAMARLFSGARLKGMDPDDGEMKPKPRPVMKAVAHVAPPPPAPKQPPFVMEIMAGAKKSETKFETSGEGK